VKRIIKPRLDHVRYYTLCAACVKRIETTLGPEVAHKVEVVVV
jgi:CRISPR/Cas system-associated endoribonuclease Cas2